MLPQQQLIARLRAVCDADTRLVAALLYGSWALGEGDEFSDVDAALFFEDAALPAIEPCEWLCDVAPLVRCYRNEWRNVVALFDLGTLIRAEFHFEPAQRISDELGAWPHAWFPSLDEVVLVDHSEGALLAALQPMLGEPPHHDTPRQVEFLVNCLLNWGLMGLNLLQRGNVARAHELLGFVSGHLLRAARLVEGNTRHFLSPTTRLEQELSPAAYQRYQRCTAPAEAAALWDAYREAFDWGSELLHVLCARHALPFPDELLARIRQQGGL